MSHAHKLYMPRVHLITELNPLEEYGPYKRERKRSPNKEAQGMCSTESLVLDLVNCGSFLQARQYHLLLSEPLILRHSHWNHWMLHLSSAVCHRPYCMISCDSLSFSFITFSRAACKACFFCKICASWLFLSLVLEILQTLIHAFSALVAWLVDDHLPGGRYNEPTSQLHVQTSSLPKIDVISERDFDFVRNQMRQLYH